MSYKDKYLKYKLKYLDLINQSGGKLKSKFINSIDKNKLDTLLTKKNKIIIRHETDNDIFNFTITGDKITYRYVIKELTKQGLNLVDNDPDHIFIEDFISDDDYYYDLVIGS